MSTGGTAVCKRLSAVKTPVGLLAGVGPLVRRNVALVGEPLRAHRASVGLLSRVGPLVPGNGALDAEPPGTHQASFSPVWARSCRGTSLLSLNRRGHIEQAYGFSPVWLRSCRGTSHFWLNRLRKSTPQDSNADYPAVSPGGSAWLCSARPVPAIAYACAAWVATFPRAPSCLRTRMQRKSPKARRLSLERLQPQASRGVRVLLVLEVADPVCAAAV